MDSKNTRALWIVILSLFFIIGYVFCNKLKTGTNYTFISGIKGTPEAILWKYQGNKVVEFENNVLRWYRLQSRAKLDTETGDLTLHDLGIEDSGLYESEILVAGVIQPSSHDIEVIDGVPMPKVTCEIQEGRKILFCSLLPQVQASFTWSGPNSFTLNGQWLEISKDTNLDTVYFCTAMNDVSKTSTEFKLQKCISGEGAITTPLTVVIVLGVLGVLYL